MVFIIIHEDNGQNVATYNHKKQKYRPTVTLHVKYVPKYIFLRTQNYITLCLRYYWRLKYNFVLRKVLL